MNRKTFNEVYRFIVSMFHMFIVVVFLLTLSNINKAILRDLITATALGIVLKLDSNCRFFSLCNLEIWWMTLKNYRDLFYLTSSFVRHLKSLCEFKLDSLSRNAQFFVPCDLEIWWMTLENNRAPLWCCFELYASFHSHGWIQTKVTVRKPSIVVKICDLLPRVTLKCDGWPWKPIGHIYVASSFMHHFIAISEFKLKLQSGKAQFGSKSAILCPVWPWNLMDDLEKQ